MTNRKKTGKKAVKCRRSKHVRFTSKNRKN